MAIIIRNRQELIDHVANLTGRRDVITEALASLDNWQGLTPAEQAATEKFLNLAPVITFTESDVSVESLHWSHAPSWDRPSGVDSIVFCEHPEHGDESRPLAVHRPTGIVLVAGYYDREDYDTPEHRAELAAYACYLDASRSKS